MKDILIENEKAYKERYGISLQGIWSDHDEAEREGALPGLSVSDKYVIEEGPEFGKESILRALIGFDGLPCLDRILSNSVPTLKALIWEPDELLFCAYCTKEDISVYIKDEKLELVIGENPDIVEKAVSRIVRDNNAYHNEVKAIGPYVGSDNIWVKKFVSIFEKIASEVSQDGYARKRYNKLPCKNFLYTVYTLNENYVISQLFDAIPTRDIPIVIVSAGPSLMKNAGELKRITGKAVVIAVTHAMKTLHNEGVEPDMVAISDASKTGFMDFDSKKGYMLISSIYAEKECREAYSGHIIYHGFNMIGDLFTTKRTIGEKDAELDTGSVATDVFSLFVSAGFKHIILVGQDLAYGDNGNTHTGNEVDDYNTDSDKEVDGVFGGKVKTRPDWERFRKFFESVIEENREIEVIDATEGGALIKGSRIMSLSEAIDRYCDKVYPIDKWINGMDEADEEERKVIEEWFAACEFNIVTVCGYLDEIINLNRLITEVWNGKNDANINISSSCRRYDVLYGQIMEGSRSDLLRLYSIEEIQKYIENALLLEGDENIVKRMQMEYQLFLSLKKGADELLEYIRAFKL